MLRRRELAEVTKAVHLASYVDLGRERRGTNREEHELSATPRIRHFERPRGRSSSAEKQGPKVSCPMGPRTRTRRPAPTLQQPAKVLTTAFAHKQARRSASAPARVSWGSRCSADLCFARNRSAGPPCASGCERRGLRFLARIGSGRLGRASLGPRWDRARLLPLRAVRPTERTAERL
jgi:hypothetical protein